MTIWERIYAALSGLGVPLAADILIRAAGQDYPDVYLVYFLVSDVPIQSADNAETVRQYRIQVNCFKRGGLNNLPDIQTAMASAGFIRTNRYTLGYHEETGHFGLAFEYVFKE